MQIREKCHLWIITDITGSGCNNITDLNLNKVESYLTINTYQ